MRALIVVCVAGACASSRRGAPPKPVGDLALPAPTPAPPLPAYHGAVLEDACIVHLHPDSRELQREREQAMLARLRPGAQIVLDALGVRPDRIVMPPGGPGPVRTSAQAIARAEQFLVATAPIWGVSTRIRAHSVEPPRRYHKHGAKWWAVEIQVAAEPDPAWAGLGRIAMLIDVRTGRVIARLARGIDPFVDICPIPPSPPDEHFRQAVLAADLHRARLSPLDDASVGRPRYEYFAMGQDVRLVVKVPIRDTDEVVLDPSTAQVLGTVEANMILDDRLQPRGDARPLLDAVEPEPERDADSD